MINMLIFLLTLSFSCIFLLVIEMNYIIKLIDKLDKRIDTLQYKTDDVLHDINIVNENVRNTYGLLGEMKDKNNNYDGKFKKQKSNILRFGWNTYRNYKWRNISKRHLGYENKVRCS